MPLKGFTCPPYVSTAGNQNAIAHCLGTCPHQCVSPLLLNAMWTAEHANPHKLDYISASLLSGTDCPRKVWYERYEPFFETPERRYWSFRGTIVHKVIEEADIEAMEQLGWCQELTMKVKLKFPGVPAAIFDANGVWTGEFSQTEDLVIWIRGTTDGNNVLTEELHDFKSMADAKTEMLFRANEVDPKWVGQLNTYRWLVAHTKTPAKLKKRFPHLGKYLPAPKKLVIQGIGMMATPRTGANFGMRVTQPGSKFKRYEERVIPDVPVWSLEDTERFIREKAMNWYRWLVLKQKPPIIEPENSWLCKSCHMNGELVSGGQCFPSAERISDLDNEMLEAA